MRQNPEADHRNVVLYGDPQGGLPNNLCYIFILNIYKVRFGEFVYQVSTDNLISFFPFFLVHIDMVF